MEKIGFYVTGIAEDAEKALSGGLRDLRLSRVADPSGEPEQRPAVALVGLNGNAEAAFETVARLSAAGTRVAVAGPAHDPELILRAMRAGAREYAVASEPKKLEQAIRSLVQPIPGATAGAVTAIFPAKGGMGATTLATNLAAALVQGGERVCLVDLDLQLGDVTAFLDVHGGYTVSDVIANMRRLDRGLLDASVAAHASGVRVLAQGERLEEAEQLDAAAIGRLFAFLRQHYAHVIVDGLRGFDELSLAALDACDRVALVVTQEVPAVRNAQRCVELFRKLGYPDEKLAVVVNRHLKGSSITAQVIADTLGLPVTASVGNDFGAASRAVHRGTTIREEAPRSPVVRDLDQLATALGRQEDAVEAPGLLRRLFGGR